MGKEHNISEANRQLGDTTYYKRLDQDPTSDHQRLLNEKLTEMLASKEIISEDNIEYLTVANLRAGRFYLLPTIHKPGNPGRPNVSANGHPTKRISEFVDLHQILPSYVQDTTYLTKLSPCDISEETLLVSLDAMSFYTNIPHEDGIEACREERKTRETMDPLTK